MTKAQTTKFNSQMKTLDLGYDGKGVVLPGALPMQGQG